MNLSIDSPRQRTGPGMLPAERWLLCGVLALLAVASFAPAIALSTHYHAFADQRAMAGLPHALDVLSNLPFLLGGLWGLALLRRPRLDTRHWPSHLLALFFGGLVLTAFCSSWYHLVPSDGRLLFDRAGMSFAFAGLLGLAIADRISLRAAHGCLLVLLVVAPLSLQIVYASGNALPWGVLQFGGMAAVLVLACCRVPAGRLALPLLPVIAWYALAKLLELGDHAVFEWTGHWVSGHSLKHLAAALAAWPVLGALRAAGPGTIGPEENQP